MSDFDSTSIDIPAVPPSVAQSTLLMTCRLVAGGAFLLAAFMKLRNPSAFMTAMESFKLFPEVVIPFFAYIVPWTEVIAGLLLVYGFCARAAGIVAAGMYIAFTIALASVIARGLPVDCGCFGEFFGKGGITGMTIVRNLVLLSASALVAIRGAGAASLDHVIASRHNRAAGLRNESPASNAASMATNPIS